MLKNISQLEITIKGKSHKFLCDMDTELGDIKEALFQFQKYIGMIEDNIKVKLAENAEKAPEPCQVTEEPKVE